VRTGVAIVVLLLGSSGAFAGPAPKSGKPKARPSVASARTTPIGSARAAVENIAPRGETSAERALQQAIDDALSSRWMKQAVNGVLVLDVRSGKTLYSFGADRQLNPASNVKLVSTGAALDALGPDYVWKTRLLGPAPDASGVIVGDVYLRGSFDPVLRVSDVKWIATSLAQKGVKRITGSVVIGEGERRDSIGSPTLKVFVTGSDRNGAPPTVSIEPASELFTVRTVATTSSKGRRARLGVGLTAQGDKILVTVSGRVRPGQRTAIYKTLARGSLFTAHTLRAFLREAGVDVVGGVKRQPEPSEAATELVLHRSPPLATVVSFVNKPSDNELADSVIWTCGQELYGGERTNPTGVRAMEAFLDKVGIERGTYRLDNGSGLSHTNHLSSRQLVQVLLHGHADSRISKDFVGSLSIAGIDGTLRGRMRGHAAQGHVFGKTGTLHGVATLSGFVTTDNGDMLVFAIQTNGFRDRRKQSIRSAQHDMVNAMYRYLTEREAPLNFTKF
jgi:D-alanyl-D-alanine carboxypeptidase/D-alanyl-D-alanine-endopeptidase (penicillin-binding protein 4)